MDIERDEKTISKMMERDESFRTGFKVINDEPVQFVNLKIALPFRLIDLSQLPGTEKEQQRDNCIREIYATPFELNRPPLFRTALVKTGVQTYHLVYNIHHIISDGWSMVLIKNEFTSLYQRYDTGNSLEPAPLILRYRDFTCWHNDQISDGERRQSAHLFWKEKVEQGIAAHTLPLDYTR
ncbi:MAG: hypothetical protein GY940_41425, partial [bacterium]|nr:hypothetical protein [bacterium]